MKKHKLAIIALLSLIAISVFPAKRVSGNIFGYDYSYFSQIPVLDQGRVKPLDTYARTLLKLLSGRDKIGSVSAIDWMAELLFNPEQSYRREIFNIANPQVTDALGLERRKKHRYSFLEVQQALEESFMTLHPIIMRPPDQLTLPQKQLLQVYNNIQIFADISRTFSLLFPEFVIPAGEIAEKFGVKAGTRITYLDLSKQTSYIQEKSHSIVDKMEKEGEELSPSESQFIKLVQQLMFFERDKGSSLLKIIPPRWDSQHALWYAPWVVSYYGQGSPDSAELLKLYGKLIEAYRSGKNDVWSQTSKQIYDKTLSMIDTSPESSKFSIEASFNRFNYFQKSLICYLGSFLLLLLGFLIWPKTLKRVSLLLLILGLILHAAGIIIRMIIMARPPVTSLYESIIFVSFVAVSFGLILELRKKDSLGILIASVAGIILHFIGMKYSADGDTMGMLVAVLDTNFWLATHVVTITIGYGCSLVGGLIGHVYLLTRIFNRKNEQRLKELYKNLLGVTYVALFFTSLGTILGGIWADQSWGRFWGWDPKENGALLIVLWLVWLIHGRLCGKLRKVGYAVGMVFTNIIVALAWFGVNLLSVGLHSYGFTENIVLNLALFCGIETVFGLGSLAYIKLKKI